MAVMGFHLSVLFILSILQFTNQISVRNAETELPVNITVPGPEVPEVVSELYESQNNKTNIIQWLLGLTGIGGGGGSGSGGASGGGTVTSPEEQPKPDPTPVDCSACTCGLTNKNHRIVGGVETVKNEYPWMTLLEYGGSFYCGASLICSKYILTAAHCVSGFRKERISAKFSVHDRNNFADIKIFSRKIKQIIRHPKYDSRTYNNDIAILKLDNEVPFEETMRPVCLPEKGRSFTGKEGIATGWGATSEGGPLSPKLQEVTVNIMSNLDCKKTGYGSNRITENMLCAGMPEGKKDSCQGDSGGPLHYVNGTSHSVVGIVSWGDGCAQANFPGVYTRVNRYITWIKANTQDCCYCTPLLIKNLNKN